MSYAPLQDDAAAFRALARTHQQPVDCANASWFLWRPDRRQGFAAQMHAMAASLSLAMSRRHLFAVDAHQQIRSTHKLTPDAEFCAEQNWACYLEPLTPCALPAVDHHSSTRNSYDFSFVRGTPLANATRHWLVSQLVSHVMRPNARIVAHLSHTRGLLGLAPVGRIGGLIGVHLRTGDKKQEAPVHSPEHYAALVSSLQKATGYQRVLLACNDDDACTACKEGVERTMKSRRRSASVAVLGMGAGGTENRTGLQDATLLVLTSALLLGEADYLVGTMSSNMGRLADELMMARTGAFPHILDLDATAWTDSQHAWGMQYASLHPELFSIRERLRAPKGRGGRGGKKRRLLRLRERQRQQQQQQADAAAGESK